jgi:hypothetical protein
MTPTSLPVTPAQPNLPDYGFQALALFPTWTRASYLAAFGVQAPNWDATKPVKLWFDTSGNDSSKYFMPQQLAASGTPAEQPLTVLDATTGQPRPLTLAEAAAVNIPGLMTYPSYGVTIGAPTDVIQQSTGASLSEEYLSTFAQAMQIAEAWGVPVSFGGVVASIVDMDPGGQQAYTFPAGESRRQYGVMWQGLPQNVGMVLYQMNQQGVGHPGSWSLTGSSTPTFVFAQPGPDGITSGVSLVTIPVPVRPLLPTEYFEQVLGGSEIINTNLLQPPSATGSVTVGDFTSADRATLASMQAQIAKIAAAMGITI